MSKRILITALVCLGLMAGTAYAATAAHATTVARLSMPKNVTLLQIVSLQKMKVNWTAPEHAKKYVVKLMHGQTVIFEKILKKPHFTFAERKITDGEAYTLKVRARATSTNRASVWQKKKFTFTDLDGDNDGIADDTDTDDDDDGILDNADSLPNDHDNDGTNDGVDDDDDNDLIDDTDDDYPLDHDNDGDPDVTDPDDDNDGILDVDEAPGQQFDEDNDGIEDYLDEDYIAEHAPTETFTIRIKNNSLVDGDITISVGDTVQWTNKDEGGHAIAAADGSWESPPLESNESYSHIFTEAGSVDYYDPTYPDTAALTGTITIIE